jgi:hypothetical protein
MNPLVRAYLERRLRILEHRELRDLAARISEQQAALRPMVERRRAEEKARRKQDGPTGFVMVDK